MTRAAALVVLASSMLALPSDAQPQKSTIQVSLQDTASVNTFWMVANSTAAEKQAPAVMTETSDQNWFSKICDALWKTIIAMVLILVLFNALWLVALYAQSTKVYFPSAELTSTIVAAEPGKTQKRPLLFVHGNSHGGFVFKGLAKQLAARGYESHLLTMPKSKFKPLQGYIDDIRDYIQNNMTTGPVLLGHSQGGQYIQQYLLNDNVRTFPAGHPRRAAAGVFLASPPAHSALALICFLLKMLWRHPVAFFRSLVTFNTAHIIGHLKGDGLEMFRKQMFTPGTCTTTVCGEGEESMEGYAARLSPVESMRMVMDLVLRLIFCRNAARPAELNIKTVTVYPEHGGIIPEEVNKGVARFWRGQMLRVKGQGHCFGEPGWEETVPARLADWLDANVSAPEYTLITDK